MTTLKGKLTFISFWHPINLETEDGELDLRVQYFGTFRELNGKKANMKYGMNDLTICFDADSEYEMVFECTNDSPELRDSDSVGMILKKSGEGWGMQNIGAYLPDILQRLNGMQVIVDVDEDSIAIRHDETEEVYEIKYTRNNSCQIPKEDLTKVCKIGQADCCIFMSVGSTGFECQKFDSMESHLLRRHAEGTMNATRIGNCKIVGRVEEN